MFYLILYTYVYYSKRQQCGTGRPSAWHANTQRNHDKKRGRPAMRTCTGSFCRKRAPSYTVLLDRQRRRPAAVRSQVCPVRDRGCMLAHVRTARRRCSSRLLEGTPVSSRVLSLHRIPLPPPPVHRVLSTYYTSPRSPFDLTSLRHGRVKNRYN